jgi:hypothetical protein
MTTPPDLGPDLGPALDERLAGVPAVPAERYLHAGRAAVRRRRRGRAVAAAVAAAVVAAAVVVAGLVTAHPLIGSDGAQVAVEPGPARGRTLFLVPASVPGLEGVRTVSSSTIPAWAQEHGHHGPAAIAPDGALWIAPEATVVRGVVERADGVVQAYALVARGYTTADGALGGPDALVWSYVAVDGGGTLDEPGRWTVDFDVWAEDQAARTRGEPGFAERLATFADDRSAELVAGPGVEIVAQRPADAGYDAAYVRQSAAEVRLDGRTWFVLASGQRVGGAFYEAWDGESAGVSDLAGFVAWVESGQGTA